jgi:hypothetical protein
MGQADKAREGLASQVKLKLGKLKAEIGRYSDAARRLHTPLEWFEGDGWAENLA